MDEQYRLSTAQINYFNLFGYLALRGLFASDIDDLTAGFEAIFADEANERIDHRSSLHDNERRIVIGDFVRRDPRLAALSDDPRVTGTVASLLGDDYEENSSDGNLFDCNTNWHADVYGCPIDVRHLKLSFYLDPLREGAGAIRLIPGSNHYQGPFATELRTRTLNQDRLLDHLGLDDPRDIPSIAIANDPGDLLLWDNRTLHSSYDGMMRRRLFSMNYREAVAA